MSNTNVQLYIDYFRQMAVKHKDLQHNPAAENGDGYCRFARWSADEVVNGLRTKFRFPALLLEMYEVVTASEIAWDIKGLYRGAFTVLDEARASNTTDEVDKLAQTERIMFDVLKQIWQDHYGPNADRATTPFQYFHFDKLQIMPVGPLFDNQFGWRVEFAFDLRQNISIVEPPAPGTFL